MTPQVGSSDTLAGAPFTRRAWWSLLGFVPSLVLAFLVGEGLASALGHPAGGDEPAPWWVMIAAAGPALLVFVVPAVLAAWFGTRAMRLGDASGRVPMVVALVVAGGFVVLNGLSALAILLS
jgi:hypothetical protein